ncbi:MAG: glycosyltransferase family 2 protein [Clostridiales bacterium]|nr:glycosyltransferase family 2 protein [Clostridiales bacterium]
MRVQVLLATMNKKDFSLIKEMNIHTDIVIANQADEFSYSQIDSAKLITTTFRGVGKNRNLALCYADVDILLFSDDDMRYVDGYEQIVIQAFERLKHADVIIFNTADVGRETHNIKNTKRVRLWNFARHGTYRIAIRRSSLLKARLSFSEFFGGGAIYSSGEDSIFLRDALRKKLRIYTSPETIAVVNQESSTWFNGYDEKFMFDKGALCSALFPAMKYFAGFYLLVKFSRRATIKKSNCFKAMLAGIKCEKNMISYQEWKERTHG